MKPFIEKPVVIFGGAGFLGSHVADSLTECGYTVRIFDLNPSPYLKKDQEMIVGDMMDESLVRNALEGAGVVYNFAGLADIDDARNRPMDTVKLNVLGNMNVLEACVAHQVKRFLFASTVYVYSEEGSFYRASKQASERFVEAYEERFGLSYTILRYGSLYGRRADERNGLYRLLKQALLEKKMVYRGSDESMREYVHVKDAADASVMALDGAFKNQHLIITGAERLKVTDLMRMIAEMLPDCVEVFCEGKTDGGHYVMTPYSFQPRIGKKIVPPHHIEIGQGLLDCMAEIHEKILGYLDDDTFRPEQKS